MKLKYLAEGQFQVLAIFDGERCPAEDFIIRGEQATKAHRTGLLKLIEKIAEQGFSGIPAACIHLANKGEKILELIKGPLRLFFFHGFGAQIVICVDGVRKKARNADEASVLRSARCRAAYFAAHSNLTLEVS